MKCLPMSSQHRRKTINRLVKASHFMYVLNQMSLRDTAFIPTIIDFH